ncbi:MAG: 2Fe-2S iron-sulfur cluster-binding protein [Thermodesulfobacteriota bacterium]
MNTSTPRRLPEISTEVIDRSSPLAFKYEGREIPAFSGDTIAGALYASGIRIMSTSFKYHRPRGLFDMGVHASEPFMEVDGRLNTRIARTPVIRGMEVKRQGSSRIDLFKLADKASGAMEVGFYYKSFYKSKALWNKSLELMRKAPGNLGEVKPLSSRDRFEAVNLTPEVLVIGGGAAGMEAALQAASADIRVVLVEAEAWLGGFFSFQKSGDSRRIGDLAAQVRSEEKITTLTSTTATAIYPEGIVMCTRICRPEEGVFERLYLIRPKTVIAATGAMDRPLIFNQNDRPGILLPQTAQRLIYLYGIKPGETALVAGGDDQTHRVALDLSTAGVKVLAVCDSRSKGLPGTLEGRLKEEGIELLYGWTLSEALGKQQVTGAEIREIEGAGVETFKLDLIVASSGRTPLFKLLALTEGRMVYHPDLGFHLPDRLPPGFFAAGRLLGHESVSAIQAQGRLAGALALAYLGYDTGTQIDDSRKSLADSPPIAPNPRRIPAMGQKKDRRFICLGNDVTEKEIDAALSEGFDSTEMIKRYTTATMGAEQGALSQANFLDYLASVKPDTLGNQKLFTPRPPIVGVRLGVLGAGLHDLPRRPPLHLIQIQQGGVPIRTGPWIRIEHFGDPESESLAVHQTAGLCDVSTLGKFRVFGPDATALLNFINTRSLNRLENHRIHYSVSCNEEGVIIDDGVILKQNENDYYVTTTTARGPLVREWYLRWCREFGWKAWVVDITDARAGMNLTGPLSREILSKLTSRDISNSALPYMHWVEADVAGVSCLLLRMGFMGELSYEIHPPSGFAEHLWKAIISAGKPLGLKPVGLDGILLCRLEKGHPLPGLDMDGNTTLYEGNYGWCIDTDRKEMAGGPMLKLLKGEPFKNVVIGFESDGRIDLTDGDLVVENIRRLGYVTSVRYSPFLGKTIGLALVKPSPGITPGGSIMLQHNRRPVRARLVKPPFFDPKGRRMKE